MSPDRAISLVDDESVEAFQRDGVTVLRAAVCADQLVALAEAVEQNLAAPGRGPATTRPNPAPVASSATP